MAEQVWIGVVGGGGAYFNADDSGNGSGAFQIGEVPGNYILEASDSFGNSAQSPFTVTESNGGWQQIGSTVNTVITHSVPPTGWQLIGSAVEVSVAHVANTHGWQLIGAAVNVSVAHVANTHGWQLVGAAVNVVAFHPGGEVATIVRNISPVGSGSITVDPDAPYTTGEIVSFTATPVTGYYFDHWTIGGVTITENPHSIELEAGANTINAYFTTTPPKTGMSTTTKALLIGGGAVVIGGAIVLMSKKKKSPEKR